MKEIKKINARAEVLRGGRIESVHRAEISVFNQDGKEVIQTSNTALQTYLRSSAKPFQATVILDTQTDTALQLPDEWIALACASHNGEPVHVKIIRAFLERIGLDESVLQCGSHPPLVYALGGEKGPYKERYSPVYHNCSGKHTGMLSACRHLGCETENYLEFDHPVQKKIRKKIELYSAESPVPLALDGCTAPVFYVTVRGMARMYRHLALGTDTSLEKIWRIMTKYPYLIAGKGRFDTAIMEICKGKIAAKVGAEGVQGCAVRLPKGQRYGINIKILDGNRRALAPLLIETLSILDALNDDEMKSLESFHQPILKNHAGHRIGEIRPVIEISEDT
jgi:L-asparaginase II